MVAYLFRKASRLAALNWRRRVSGRPKRRAGGLVLRKNTIGEEILLVSSRKNPSIWIVPSGTVESGETPEDAALREVREEAGVNCTIETTVGLFFDEQSLTSTSIFVMTVVTDEFCWEDQGKGRLRQWWKLDASLLPNIKPRDRIPLQQHLTTRQQQNHTTESPPARENDVEKPTVTATEEDDEEDQQQQDLT